MLEASSPTSLFDGTWSATALTMVICGTVAGYNAIEGLVLILTTFKHYEGLYFWSLIVADLGILIYMIFVTLWYFALTIRLAALLPLYVGWVCMVTGQSVVLCSRLGIVLGPNRANILAGAKWMIIIDAIIFHTSTISTMTQDETPVAQLICVQSSLSAASMRPILHQHPALTTIWNDYISPLSAYKS